VSKIDLETLITMVQPCLDSLVETQSSVNGALVVTVDGHLIAKRIQDDTSVKRLASMSSSLMSLGNTITGELAMGNCRNVIVENEGGYAAFMHINKKLVLVSLTQSPNGLGLLLSASRNCASNMTQRFQTQ
jgi:hypothetical protein